MSESCALAPYRHHSVLPSGSLVSTGVVAVVVLELVVMVAVVLELVVMVAVILELVLVAVILVMVSIDGSGTLGLGQVTSLASSGQNSLIFWKRYHWRVGESPEGMRSSGRSVAVGVHSCFSRLNSTSGVSDFSRAKTCPLLLDEKRRWWKDLIPTNFLMCS